MTKIQRLSGAQGLLAISALLAVWLYAHAAPTPNAAHGRATVLGLAGVLLGALLALVGQTYQTGADTWELFGWWALLLLPWALAARSQGVWLFWVVVANIALALLLGQRALSWWIVFGGPGFPSLVLAAVNLVMLGIWEVCAQRWNARTGVGPRLLALVAVGVLTLALLWANFRSSDINTYTGLAWIVATLGLGYFYLRIRLDLVILALLAAGIMCVSLRLVAEWLFLLDNGNWTVLVLAAVLMGEAVLAARWLRRLATSAPGPLADAEPAEASAGNVVEAAQGPVAQFASAQPQSAPWFVQGLLAFSAWIATALLLLFLFGTGLVRTPSMALALGLVFCAVAVGVMRSPAGPFWRQCATAMGVAGQILVVAGLSDAHSIAGSAALVLALGTVIYVFAPDAILRFLSAGMMALALFVLVFYGIRAPSAYEALLSWGDVGGANALSAWLPATVCGAIVAAVAFLVRERLPLARRDALQPLAWAFAITTQAVVALTAGVQVWELPALWHVSRFSAAFVLLAALWPAAVAVALVWPRRAVLTRSLCWGVPLGLLVLSIFWLPSLGVAYALVWLLLGFALERPRLRMFGQATLLGYLVFYYYALQLPLLEKAIWLAGAGVLLLLLRALLWMVPRLTRTAGPTRAALARPGPGRAIVIAAGLLLVLAVVNGGIWQREKLLSTGHVVRLQLAPVDPRSLMQGDYMQLNFAAVEAVRKMQGELPPTDGVLPTPTTDAYLIMTEDTQGVAQPLRLQPLPQPHAEKEIALRYRLRPEGVRIVTNAYFFPEGSAPHYAQARYGEFRVGDDGTGLLVRLLDQDLKPL
jgi:uncharacterized membrane-anchored protein/uncharacterized membrane protein